MWERCGIVTCKRLKRDAGLANTPIIFMTGLAETEHIVRGLEAGGVDYVVKPVDSRALLAGIDQAFRVRAGQAAFVGAAPP